MLDRAEVARLLRMQADAYALLMWLDRACVDDPGLLSVEVADLLGRPDTAAGWIERHRHLVPPEQMPDDPRGAFANLFSSFFATSFRIERVEFDNRLVWSRLALGVPREAPSRAGLGRSQALAVKHLAASEDLPVSYGEASRLVRADAELRAAALLWTYVWELDRRARRKGKGPVVHRIWRSIPWETKRELRVEDVWSARERLLDAVRATVRVDPFTERR